MKYVWLILCGLMVVCNGLHAQEKLRSKVLFDGRYNNREGAVEVLVKGKKLAPYHLTLFRSLTLQADSTEIATITALVESDAQKAAEKETWSMVINNAQAQDSSLDVKESLQELNEAFVD